ncbi:C-terminal domain of 1-Cys peroxiredoxin [Pedobacter caeni]|uniref:C-terminal domain of 1-Cys peroxiredoxin n=1 Tax=Pedobacter caeni TaxID=288992 RepID=A0A1M5GMX0_9SPHI|nr:C-terminal domain of 1-Cys peroxiredoxin [Pedobacter caeni]
MERCNFYAGAGISNIFLTPMFHYFTCEIKNPNEILRVIDSLQLTDNYRVATPADWNPGDDVVISNAIKTEDSFKHFPKRVREVKPYLRYTQQLISKNKKGIYLIY